MKFNEYGQRIDLIQKTLLDFFEDLLNNLYDPNTST